MAAVEYDIMRGSAVFTTVSPEGAQTRTAMGGSYVEMSFTVTTAIAFKKGDWLTVYGERYQLFASPSFKKVNDRRFEYQLKFEHEFYSLKDIVYMGLDSENEYTTQAFSLMGDAAAHMLVLINNANRVQTGWTLGVVDATISKLISYDNEDLIQALTRIASEFETEYWIENKTIHLTKRTGSSGLILGYGRGRGLLNLTKGNKDDNATIFTRLYVEGSSQNLPVGYRVGAKTLRIPAANGTYIQDPALVALYGVIEKSQTFDDIFPHRVGTITALGDDEFTFYDSAIDFDVNDQLLSGRGNVVFQTGRLAGYTFEINTFDNGTKKFIFNEIDEKASDTGKLPSGDLVPHVGDEYILVDIQMPASYVTNAENDLHQAALDYYAKGSDIAFNDKYSGDCDPIFFKQNNIVPQLGLTARIIETRPVINVEKRISSIKRDLRNPWKYELEFTDKIELSQIQRSYAESKRTQLYIYGAMTGAAGGIGTGSNAFLGTLSENNGYLFIRNIKAKAGFADLADDANHAANADFADVADVAREVESADFSSGFAGEGHQLKDGVLTVDKAIIRESLQAYELLINKITGQGGSFIVTSVAKIKEVIVASPNVYNVTIDTDGGTIPVSFQVDDIIRCQVFNGQNQKYYRALVTAVGAGTFTMQVTDGSGIPAAGDELFQFDNLTNTGRKGIIYLTNSDSGAPYLDVDYGFYTDPQHRTKVRLGRLDGVTDQEFGALSGWGLYAQNAYLTNAKIKGQITVTPGSNVYTKNETDTTLQGITDEMEAVDQKVDAMGNDNIASPLEKQTILKPNFDRASAEVEDYKTQAQQLGVDSSAYNTAYNNLSSYVAPLLTDLNAASTIDGAALRNLFQQYYIQLSLLVKNCQAKQNNNSAAVSDAALAAKWAGGKPLYNDPTFVNGMNGLTVYNNAGTGAVNWQRLKPMGTWGANYWVPNTSGYAAYFYQDNTIAHVPGWGGFTFGTQSRAGARFLVRLIISMPIWNSIEWITNGIGDGGTARWLTGQYGARDVYAGESVNYKEYICYVECGKTGTFSTTNFFYFSGGDWCEAIVAFAGVYDITDVDDTATNAQQAANNAQDAADAANNLLADIVNDNKISGDEKPRLLVEWYAIQDEVPRNDSQADAFGVSRANYDAAYSVLASMISSTGAFNDLSATTPIGGVAWRNTWRSYYDEKVILLNAIAAKAKALADNAQGTADGKNTTFIGASAPTAKAVGDIWFDTTAKKWKTWDGATWVIRNAVTGIEFLADALNQSSEVTGGLTLTSVIGARDASNVVRSYMSGLASNPIAFAAGVTNFATGTEGRKIVLRHDGSGYVAGGNISWNADDTLTVFGEINALTGTFDNGIFTNASIESGTIGGFLIANGGLLKADGSGGSNFDTTNIYNSAAFTFKSHKTYYSGGILVNDGDEVVSFGPGAGMSIYNNKQEGKTLLSLQANKRGPYQAGGGRLPSLQYQLDDIALRIVGGYVYMDEIRDINGVGPNLKGRLCYYYNSSTGDMYLTLDSSNF